MVGKRAARKTDGKLKGGQVRLDQMLVPRRSTRSSANAIQEKQTDPIKPTVKKDLKDEREIQLLEIEPDDGKSITLLAGNSKKRTLKNKIEDNEGPKVKKALKMSKEEQSELLKNFDINHVYGPCRGILRRERYDRALKYKLQPLPNEIILEILNDNEKEFTFQKCVWDQHELLKHYV